MKEKLSQKFLKKIIHYDPDTGIFIWIRRPVSIFGGKDPQRMCNIWNLRFAETEAGTIWTPEKHKTSYLRIRITFNGKTKLYLAHRLAILYTAGHSPPEQVDHIDGNGLNNRRDNLRKVSNQENHKNCPMQSNNTSGTVGVCWHKVSQKWQSQIKVDGKNIHGGSFTNKDDAIAKRKQMEIEYGFHKNHGRKGDK